MMNEKYHIPVLLNSSVDGLVINPDGTYVDVTFGGGGHSREILNRLSEKGKLFAFDQDEDAQKNKLDDKRFVLIPQNFRYIRNYLALYGVNKVDGILADLGVSSHQFDEAKRGFSIRESGDLDMRMNQEAALSAKTVVNSYEEEKLVMVFKAYGELKEARRAARVIVNARQLETIESTQQLVDLLIGIPKRKQNQFLAQVFQAIRIEVNQEMEALKEFLLATTDLIKQEGRLSVISYHSLEDRLVKNFIKKGKFQGELEKDFYGNTLRPFVEVNRKIIIPTEQEIEMNSRARSAKLRIAQRV